MLYSNKSELPKEVKALPDNLQDMWMKRFNEEYAKGSNPKYCADSAWKVINDRLRTKSMYFKFNPFNLDDKMLLAGIGTSERIDAEGEITEKESLIKALQKYMEEPKLCDMHIQDGVVGKVIMANYLSGNEMVEFCQKNKLDLPHNREGLAVIAEVTDKRAMIDIKRKNKVGFSIGFRSLQKKIKNKIYNIVDSVLEMSIVDSPSDKDCFFTVLKMYNGNGIIENMDAPADVPQKINKVEKKINKEINKMDPKLKAKLVELEIDPNTEDQAHIEFAKMKMAEDQKEFETKIKTEAEKIASEKINEYKKEVEEKIKAADERVAEAVKKLEDSIPDTPKTQGKMTMTTGNFDEDEIITKGLETGEFDLTGFKLDQYKPGRTIEDYTRLQCKCYAAKILKEFNEGANKKVVMLESVAPKFRTKAVLDADTTTTGASLQDVSYNQFIVDQPFHSNPLLALMRKQSLADAKEFVIKRRTAYGYARFVGSTTAYSATAATYSDEKVQLKIIRYDGGVTDFLESTTSINALATELYAAKQSHDRALEAAIIHGTKYAAAAAATGGVTETGGYMFEGLIEAAGKIVNKSETVITTSMIDIDIIAAYDDNARMLPSVYLFDPLTMGKVNNLMRGEMAINSIMLDGGIKVDTLNNVPIAKSYSLNNDAVAAPTASGAAGSGGDITDTLFCQVSAYSDLGETVKGTEFSIVCSNQKATITITNRTADMGYKIYLGESTGNTFLYANVIKSSDTSTVFTLLTAPTFPTVSDAIEGRVDTDDRLFLAISTDPMRGSTIKNNTLGEIKQLGSDGVSERFVMRSYAALENLDEETIMAGVFAKA